MTFCIAAKVDEGLVALADTLITSGNETLTAKKISVHQTSAKHSIFIMTSGLRSVRDKALTYFQEVLDNQDESFDRLYQAVNAFGVQVRRVRKEDRPYLQEEGVLFNLQAIIGGRLEHDNEQKLYLLYSEGNWVEATESSVYFIIGNSNYGKPIVNRVLNCHASMTFALKASFIAFDATRISANDVGFPIDVLAFPSDSKKIFEKRFYRDDLEKYSLWWQKQVSGCLNRFSDEWLDGFFDAHHH